MMKATFHEPKDFLYDDEKSGWGSVMKTDELYVLLWNLSVVYVDEFKVRVIDRVRIPPKTVGVWDENDRMCYVHIEKGKMIHSMGVTRKKRRALFLEETLWLIQQRKLAVVLDVKHLENKKKYVDWRVFNQRYFSDTPYFFEWYAVYNLLRESHYIVRRPENGKPRIFRFTKRSITFHDTEKDTTASLEEIREASFDVFDSSTNWSRKRALKPNWVCFVCLFEDRPPRPSQLRVLLKSCAPIPARIAVVDSIKNVVLYRLGKVYALKETEREEKLESRKTG